MSVQRAGVHEAPGRNGPERLIVSQTRVAVALALAGWAGVFWFLLLADRSQLYLSSRTDWVVPVGTACLTIGLAGRLMSLRTTQPEPLTRRSAWGIALILVPVATILVLPPASLGSYAASRRSSFASGGVALSPEDIAGGSLSLADVAGALRSEEGTKALVRRAGESVDFTGFVTRESGQPADEFTLTRFLISCCVADALSVQVRVVGAPAGKFAPDDWVRVEGKLYPLGGEVIVDATGVTAVGKPKRPYLSP